MLGELKYFIAVAEELHFGRAARRLHISQPPLTQHIKKLEVQLGALLFERTKRSVKLTEAGSALLQDARRIVADCDRLGQVVAVVSQGETGFLRSGFIDSAAFTRLRALMKVLNDRLPGVALSWEEMPTNDQLQALRAGQIDLGIVHMPADRSGLMSLSLDRARLVAALPLKHACAGRRWIRLSDLQHDDFILSPRRNAPGLYDAIITACTTAGFSPRVQHRPERMLTKLGLVSLGIGVSLVPAWMSACVLPNVTFVDIRGAVPSVEVALLWNPDNRSSALYRTVTLLQETLRKSKATRRSGQSTDHD
jgi:DNA-binding transcriptional LysR family regulator